MKCWRLFNSVSVSLTFKKVNRSVLDQQMKQITSHTLLLLPPQKGYLIRVGKSGIGRDLNRLSPIWFGKINEMLRPSVLFKGLSVFLSNSVWIGIWRLELWNGFLTWKEVLLVDGAIQTRMRWNRLNWLFQSVVHAHWSPNTYAKTASLYYGQLKMDSCLLR